MKEHKQGKIRQESRRKWTRMTENNQQSIYFAGFKELMKEKKANQNGSDQFAHKMYSKHTQALCCLPARARGQQ